MTEHDALERLDDLVLAACDVAVDDADLSLAFAVEFGACLPQPGAGSTQQRWGTLAGLAARDLTLARVFEAHTDALAILAEAGEAAAPGSWGVFAAEAPASRLEARRTGSGWRVSGTKPWCSLGDRVDHALVTAHVEDGRRLFAVDLHHDSVRADAPDSWVARGLRSMTTMSVHFDHTPATPVGATGWYLSRPGFEWGGIGVAACWLGGAEALVGYLRRRAAARSGDALSALHLGAADVAVFAARTALLHAAQLIDDRADTAAGVLALRVRTVVADAAETVLRHAAHGLGPAPLGFDAEHARRVADLQLYIRQHHAEADLAVLGGHLVADEPDSAP